MKIKSRWGRLIACRRVPKIVVCKTNRPHSASCVASAPAETEKSSTQRVYSCNLARRQAANRKSEPTSPYEKRLYFFMSRCIVIYTSPVRGHSDFRRVKEVMKISVRCLLQVTLAIFLSISAGVAQQITGSITGAVTDPSGAAVAGAAVKLTNMGT